MGRYVVVDQACSTLVRRRRWVIAFMLLLLGVYLVTVTFGLGGQQTALGNLAQCVAASLAATLCLLSAGKHGPRLKRAWRLLGLSAASWALGQVLWTYYELFADVEVPFPSLSDVGYLAAAPLAVFGLATFIDTPSGRVAWLRAMLEGTVIGTGALFIGWAFVLGPIYRAEGNTILTQTISLAYPFADMVIASLVAYAACRAHAETRRVLGMVGCALVLLAFADSGFAMLTVHGTYHTGSFTDLGWFGGYLVLGLASLRVRSTPVASREHRIGNFARVASFLPFVPPIASLGLVIAGAIDPRDDPVLWVLGISIVVGAGVLHLVTLADNAKLTAHLEARTMEIDRKERFFRSIVQNSSDGVLVFDESMKVIYQTPSASNVLGVDSSMLGDASLADVFGRDEGNRLAELIGMARLRPDRPLTIEVSYEHGDDRACFDVTVAYLVEDEDVGGIVVTVADITAHKTLEQQLIHEAFHDRLTTLPNRALFQDSLAHALRRFREEGQRPPTMLLIDLDGFKSVNDSLGHAAGDKLLQEFAERAGDLFRESDVFARLGGDEFAVLVERLATSGHATRLAERMLERLAEPFLIDGRELFVNASIGIATGETAATAEELQRNADVAMYAAKAAGGGGLQVYVRQMHDDAMARFELESGLRKAIDRNEFILHFQPIAALGSDRIASVEALLRWNHPDQGLMPPDVFIPVAEDTGLIVPIGSWVLRESCRVAAGWHRTFGSAAPRVSVNLSHRQVQRPDLIDEIQLVLAETGLPPSGLCLEVTETMLAEDPAATAARLHSIKQLGVSLAIDDFGTGYSSLSYLRQFPFDQLKIDRKFIATLASQSDDVALIEAILNLGSVFAMETVAEGIETIEQYEALLGMGCAMGQGYFFARPAPAEAMTSMLTQIWADGHSFERIRQAVASSTSD